MTIPRSVGDVLRDHVTWQLESIDRLYLNLYVPILQRPEGVAHFWIAHRGHRFASSALMTPMTRAFVTSIDRFAQEQGIDVFTFDRKRRKEEVAKEYLARFEKEEGVLFIGKAQEKASVVRTERRVNPHTGATYPWLVKRTAMVNQFYFYCVDRDFGPFFIKFSSYFPYNGKVCLNGHEYLKRQLAAKGVTFEALDNGLLSCSDPKLAQRVADGLSDKKVEAFVRKWFRQLPHPFPAEDRKAGFRYEISILQSEFSLTQVLDRPVSGRVFFEQVIRENLDIGRPDRVQLVFNRRISRRTPGTFRTRILTDGVTPSLYINYKNSQIKQYHKEGRALRTETTINDTKDFDIGRRLKNLSALREVGFEANRRLLDVQRISHDCTIGEQAFDQIQRPVLVAHQRAPALRFGDPRVMALFSALLLFRLLPRGFTNRRLREETASILGLDVAAASAGRMTYDLRRLRLHGLIERIPESRRYRVTDLGFRAALFLTRSYARLIRPGLALVTSDAPPVPTRLRDAVDRVDAAIARIWEVQDPAA